MSVVKKISSWSILRSDMVAFINGLWKEILADKGHLILIVIFLFISVFWRMYLLAIRPMGYDETFTFTNFAQHSFERVFTDYHQPNNHILHSIFVRISYLLFGAHIWSIRLTAFIFGCVLLPMGYILGRIFYGPKAALLALSLIGASGVFVHYSVNARGYGIVTFFFFAMLLLGRYILKKDNGAAWGLFTFCAVLGLYTIPVMIYPIAVVLAWMAVNSPRRRDMALKLGVSLACTVVLTGLLYLPIAVKGGFDFSGLMVADQLTAKIPIHVLARELFLKILPMDWNFFNFGFMPPVGIILTAAAVITGIKNRTISLEPQRYSIFILTLAVLVLAHLIQRIYFFERVWTPFAGIYLLSAAGGLAYLIDKIEGKARHAKGVLTALVCCFIFLNSIVPISRDPKRIYVDSRIVDAKDIMAFLKNNTSSEDTLLLKLGSGWDNEVFNFYLKLYKMDNWIADYHKNVIFLRRSFELSQDPGDILLITFNNGNNCYQYYHCDGAYDLAQLINSLKIDRRLYHPPVRIKDFASSAVYAVRYLGP